MNHQMKFEDQIKQGKTTRTFLCGNLTYIGEVQYFIYNLLATSLLGLIKKFDSKVFMILVIITFVFCTVALCSTVFSDPGIIPAITFENKKFNYIPHNDLMSIDQYMEYATKARPKFSFSSFYLDLRYCQSCNIYRPPRASHCSFCGYCIEKFDHHCPWIGCCIGKKNYVRFMYYTFSISLHLLLIFIFCIVEISSLSRIEKNNGIWARFVLYFIFLLISFGVFQKVRSFCLDFTLLSFIFNCNKLNNQRISQKIQKNASFKSIRSKFSKKLQKILYEFQKKISF